MLLSPTMMIWLDLAPYSLNNSFGIFSDEKTLIIAYHFGFGSAWLVYMEVTPGPPFSQPRGSTIWQAEIPSN